MIFWSITGLGFGILIALICLSMAIPVMMMGQHVDDLWMREPVLAGLAVANSIAVTSYLGLITWLDRVLP